MVQWMLGAGVELEHVPFRADALVITEVLAGRLDVGSIVLGSAAGRTDVRLLAVFDRERHPDFPDAPTAVQQEFDVAPASFGGLFSLSGTPEPILAKLETADEAAAPSDLSRKAVRRGSQPPNYFLPRAAFAARLAADDGAKRDVPRAVALN